MRSLDLLVIESHRGASRFQAEALEAAGHRVRSCYEPGSRGFPCVGIDSGRCPIEDGVDVVLLVRKGISPRPTHLESPVSCAIRAGLPLVEDGSAVLDPFGPWVDRRVTCGVVAECEAAAAGTRTRGR